MKTPVLTQFNERLVANTATENWAATGAAGVERIILESMELPTEQSNGIDRASERVSSLLRFAPGARFPADSSAANGMELLVLAGSLADESGDYPAGTYLRVPSGQAYETWSEEGATVFVKQGQFHPADSERVMVDANKTPWSQGLVDGLAVMPLHNFVAEGIAFVRWAPGTRFNPHTHPGGEEIFVIDGVFRDEYGDYPAGTWLRNPPWSAHHPFTEEEGALIYVKTGHLSEEWLRQCLAQG